MSANIPEGYMENAQGGLDRVEMVKPVDKLRDQTVRELVTAAKKASQDLTQFKAGAMSDVEKFIEISALEYGVSIGGKKGNVTLTSYDGRYKVQRAISENIIFDERIQAAKALIDECIHEWGAGAKPQIMTLVNDAFQVDKEGKVSITRIFGLRRLDIHDPKWVQAMKAIADSVQVSGSKSYIRIYERNAQGGYDAIPLDVAAA